MSDTKDSIIRFSDVCQWVVTGLQRSGKTLAVAESLTGGLVSARLVDIPGASAVFLGGVVAYSEAVKKSVLQVDAGELQASGAVSEPVAKMMATGVARLLGADYGISTTGVAGPGDNERGQSAGLVYLGLYVAERDKSYVLQQEYRGGRQAVRQLAAQGALMQLLDALNGVGKAG